jgi:zinc transport system permease protein
VDAEAERLLDELTEAVAPEGAATDGAETAAEGIAETVAPTWSDFAAGWDQGIYQDPILCGVLAGLVLGMLGVFIVLRRAVFVTATISQAAGLGVALSFYCAIHLGFGVPPVLGALAVALLATGALALPAERWRLPRESLLGFAFLAASAGAILVGDRISQEAHDISAILFGTAVLVRKLDLILVGVIGAAVTLVTIVSYRGLVFVGFDRVGAEVHGLPVRRLELLLWLLVAVEVSVTTRAIGALPVFAFAVLPAIAALAMVERLRWALVIAAMIGAVAGALGYLLAFFGALPVGASQAAVCTLAAVVGLALARLRSRRAHS